MPACRLLKGLEKGRTPGVATDVAGRVAAIVYRAATCQMGRLRPRANSARGDGESRRSEVAAISPSIVFDMATDAPTILATSGGYKPHDRLRFQFANLVHYAVELSGASAVVPQVCVIGTARG